MCKHSDKPCWLHLVFLWSITISAIVAVVVSLIIKYERDLLEKKQDEKDADIKEFGC
jgi:xanthine/uracil permease